MTRSQHKKNILNRLARILRGEDLGLCPPDMMHDVAEYARWWEAKRELVAEFRRRSSPPLRIRGGSRGVSDAG